MPQTKCPQQRLETQAALTASRWRPLSQSAWGVISRIQTMSGLLGLSTPQTHLYCGGKTSVF